MIEHPELYQVRVQLSKKDRELILKKCHPVPESLLDPFRAGVFEDNRLVFTPTLAELRDIVEYLKMQHRYAESRSERGRFKRIHEKLWDYLRDVERDIRMQIASGFTEHREAFHEEIRERLEQRGVKNIEEANRELQRLQDEYNRRPIKDFGGLSPLQMRELLYNQKWDDPTNGLWVNPNLSEEDVCGARMLINARIFLNALQEEEGTRATVADNLNRRFVERLFNELQWWPGYRRELRRKMTKQYNEQDFWDIHVLRVLLELAKYIKEYKQRFVVTKRAAEAFDPERAGKSYAHLFVTYFRKLNLDYVARLDDIPEIQRGAAYSFYRIGQLTEDWVSHLDVIEQAITPNVKGALYSDFSKCIRFEEASERLLEPLEAFGLLEKRDESRYWFFDDEPVYLRKTPLFDKLLKFRL
ncbi:MAG: hypothetical protein R6V12_08135 [Candidatus Hydrogenedentota bacterium]